MDQSLAPPPAPARRPWHRTRRGRIISRTLLALLAVLLGAYVYQYVTKGRFWRGTFERMVSEKLGRPVKVAGEFNLYLDPDVRFRADGLSIANPAWAERDELFAARSIRLDAPILKLIFGEVTINNLVVDGGRIGLQRRADGSNSWTFPGPSDFEVPDILRAAVTDTQLSFIDAKTRSRVALTFGDIAGRAAGGSQSVSGPLTFRGGGRVADEPFTLDGAITTPNEAAGGGRLGLRLAATIVQTRITVAGTLPGATRIEGADLGITAEGRNLQRPALLFDVALPATRPYRLATRFTKAGREYRFTQLKGRIGDSDIAGRLTGVAPEGEGRFRLTGDLASRTLDIKDIGPLVGYRPERLERGASVVRTAGGTARVLPDAPLAVDGLGKFDAAITYRARAVRTGGVAMDNLRLDLGLDDRVLALKPLAFDLAGGRLIANIGIDARNRPVRTDYDIRLTQVRLGRLLTGFKVEDSGTTASVRGRVQLRGEGDTVAKSLASADGRIALVFPAGTLWVRNIELAELDIQNYLTALLGKKLKEPRQINCGVIAFTVSDGRAVADPIVFDTNKAVIRGQGGFSFKDESLAMSVEADSKQFSLFSAQSPIGLRGQFARPGINVLSGELIGRGLAGVALGVAATPLAAIASFIDFGDAKDQNCTPILQARRDSPKGRKDNAKPKA